MLLTKECDYAIRIVRALADLEKKSVQDIFYVEHVPVQFAYKILKKLELSGLVCSHRGAQGGYELVKAPALITLYDVVAAVEPRLFIHECLKPEHMCSRNTGENHCKVHTEFDRLQEIVISALKEKTIDMVV